MAYFDLIDWNVAKDFAATLQSFGILIGLLWGGLWTYRLFVKNRQKYPRANLAHKIFHTILPDNKIYLQVKVIISNIGNVLICLDSGFTRVSQIKPVVGNSIKSINDFENNSANEIEWPMLDKKTITEKKDDCEIEPGESDEKLFEYLLDPGTEIINIYSYFTNVKKRSFMRRVFKKERDIGWQTTTIYHLKEENNV